ncbi:MAG TPA: DinB family protein [Ktedonobacteraceae bacterium]|nr:DinB family protein [Ktedonobacteraceae bacterium]
MVTSTLLAPPTRTALLADLEGLWQSFDELVGILGPDDWSGKHGKHWTFTDVPYHLAYFDLEVIASAIRRGLHVPLNEQVMRTEAEQDSWNEIRFTQRPASTTPQQCLEQMRASRQAIRDAVAGLSEADLERPVFVPLVGLGWVSVRVALETCYSHTWNHFMQLRFWMKCIAPMLNPDQTHLALSCFMASFARNLDREQAAEQPGFIAVMEFSGPGGGAWTLDVAGRTCHVSEGRAAHVDVVMIQSPETFVKTRTGIEHPRLARLSGKIKVRGLGNLGTFEKLFPIKSLDFAPAPVGTLGVSMAA